MAVEFQLYSEEMIARHLSTSLLRKRLETRSKTMNPEVMAEGIENRNQLDLLQDKDCRFGQGCLLSPSLLLDEVSTLLSITEVTAWTTSYLA